MNVVDAGVVIELLVGGLDFGLVGDQDLAAPHLIDSEVTQVLRGLVCGDALKVDQAGTAITAFSTLAIARFPTTRLIPRIWELRHNLTAYDATYVALTEHLDATALLTTDARLARAPGPKCAIEVLPQG